MTNKKVLIYTTLTCPFCIRTKQFLKENNISYEEFDVAKDQVKLDEMMSKSGQMGVPVLDIEGEIVVGFDKGKISQLLGIE